MTRNNRRESTIEMFADYTDMTDREAEAFVSRELVGMNRDEVAQRMGNIDKSTVDSHVQNARQKATLPKIKRINRQSATNTGSEEGRAVECYFENGTLLRYVWDSDRETILEQWFTAYDPHSVFDEFTVGANDDGADDLDEYLVVALEMYTKDYETLADLVPAWETAYKALTNYNPR